jgi:hypothetical protein
VGRARYAPDQLTVPGPHPHPHPHPHPRIGRQSWAIHHHTRRPYHEPDRVGPLQRAWSRLPLSAAPPRSFSWGLLADLRGEQGRQAPPRRRRLRRSAARRAHWASQAPEGSSCRPGGRRSWEATRSRSEPVAPFPTSDAQYQSDARLRCSPRRGWRRRAPRGVTRPPVSRSAGGGFGERAVRPSRIAGLALGGPLAPGVDAARVATTTLCTTGRVQDAADGRGRGPGDGRDPPTEAAPRSTGSRAVASVHG